MKIIKIRTIFDKTWIQICCHWAGKDFTVASYYQCELNKGN